MPKSRRHTSVFRKRPRCQDSVRARPRCRWSRSCIVVPCRTRWCVVCTSRPCFLFLMSIRSNRLTPRWLMILHWLKRIRPSNILPWLRLCQKFCSESIKACRLKKSVIWLMKKLLRAKLSGCVRIWPSCHRLKMLLLTKGWCWRLTFPFRFQGFPKKIPVARMLRLKSEQVACFLGLKRVWPEWHAARPETSR